jgi:hypothetical protein
VRWVKGAARRPLRHSVARFGEGAARLDVAAVELGVVDEEMGREADGRGTLSGVGSGGGRAEGRGKAFPPTLEIRGTLAMANKRSKKIAIGTEYPMI